MEEGEFCIMMKKFFIYSNIVRVKNFCFKVLGYFYYSFIFQCFGRYSRIVSPLAIDGAWNIRVGERVFIGDKSWLAALPLTGENECLLEFGEGTYIGHFSHIYCTRKIIVEDNVLIADKVYISDNTHGYENINIPIKCQPIIQRREVIIGEGSWLGENVCVIGAKIGKHCVIGANSVVTKDIPDYCIAVGIPAKVIKRYDFEKKQWIESENSLHCGGGKKSFFLWKEASFLLVA